ncbi:MAG: dynamin family protein, partial [Actinomycetota bacterium]|nr:dynamin family protein [Actinomycetota bacterium]
MSSLGLDLVPALTDVRGALDEMRFDLDTENAASARRDRLAAVQQIDDYLLPRMQSLDAPLLAVVGGSTGAGKSTLVNSLLGTQVTQAGVLRPTTRAPVLVCHPSDRRWFEDARVLPGLARMTGASPESGTPGTLHLVESEDLPPGLALLDAPDIDSVVASNRELAAQLLAAADLWLFVTTAARYADAVPWDLLDEASRRSAAVAVILDRVPPEAVDEVSSDLRRLLVEHGLPHALLHSIAESPLEDGRVPESQVAPIRTWLVALAKDAEARGEVIRTTLEGALRELEQRAAALTAASSEQQRAAASLRAAVEDAYDGATADVDEQVRTGTLLRGEVLARWQEFVGTGELMRSVQAKVGRFRDRLWSTVTGRQTSVDGVQVAVEHGVEAVVHAAADRAAARSVASWRQSTTGRALVAGHERDLG